MNFKIITCTEFCFCKDSNINRDRAGGRGWGALAPPPPTFVLYKIKIKESSNKIAEEISLVHK